ncbi:hypothetical protein Clacol_002869 [Clathrus columnatus]|uniref:Translation initiation factor 5A C-terminal domain-containing protein n=1 Tax=Clathrus columnatus TaxID=1419009 RepID=A0AAV5A9R0_9AGAM|nr:hypothetical protein Clacol_002869 [Clathrus columnatus]
MSDDEHTQTFEQSGSGASLTYPMQCSALRKNGHVVIKNRPCKIVDMSTSKTGKHGHAKVHLVGIDEDISPSTHNMDVPNVTRTEYQLVNIDDDYLNLMSTEGNAKDDVKVPEGDIGQQIKSNFDEGKDLLVTILTAMGEESAISFKEAPKEISIAFMATTTTTPLSSPTRKSTNHPYGVKSISSGILAPSNTTEQTQPTRFKHHHHPAPYSPSTSTIRSNDEQTQNKALNKSPKSEKSNDSASPSKYSNTWLARNSQGEPVTLPRHPYSWNPQQLALYLAADLHGDDGTPLDSETVQAIVGFVQDCKISGRVFLMLDEEDFQEMHGLDPSQCNVMRDAASILRKHALPYKPSRVLSAAIKRGKVRSIVDVFEKSASETSDTGEDDPEDLPKVSSWKQLTGFTIGDKSKLDDETSKTRVSSQNTVHEPMVAPGTDPGSGAKTQFNISDGSGERALHAVELEQTERSSVSFLEQKNDQHVSFPEPQLVPVLPPQPSTPTDIFVTDKVAYHPGPTTEQINSPFPVFREPEDVPDEDSITPQNTTREIDVASIPAPREENEPSMAELYTQTYGDLPPTSSRTIPVEMRYVEEPVNYPSWPQTALRPVRGKDKIPETNHGALQDLFTPAEQSGPPGISGDSVSTEPQTDREREALLAVEVLKARLVEVENRLEAMERAEVVRGATDPDPKTFGEQWQHRRRHYSLSSDDFSEGEAEYFTNPPPSTGLRALRDILVGSATDLGGTRSWQNTAILLAGATTGVSVVLLPALLRHFWSRW